MNSWFSHFNEFMLLNFSTFWLGDGETKHAFHVSSNTAVPSRRINIGSRYQAEIPELRTRSDAELDQHRAELVWTPLSGLEDKPDFKQKGQKNFTETGRFSASSWNFLRLENDFITPTIPSDSGRPHAPGLLQRFVWRRHQPGVSSPLSAPVWRGHNGESGRTIHVDQLCRNSHKDQKHVHAHNQVFSFFFMDTPLPDPEKDRTKCEFYWNISNLLSTF